MTELRRIADRLDLIERISIGRDGEVYRAKLVFNGEIVAVKCLRADSLSDEPDAVERFQREAEALQIMDHPNIVMVKAAFQHERDYYIIMEYVGGGSLKERLSADGPLPIHDILEISLDLADALTRSHRVDIIHRDVKPANILFAEDGSVRLSDFGVAHMGNKSRITQTGDFLGSLFYTAPETLIGQDITDHRADIWSFGVVLYEMLTGRLPFEGETFPKWLNAVTQEPPFDLMQYREDTPKALHHLIQRMIAKNIDDRIPSTRQIGAILEGILDTL